MTSLAALVNGGGVGLLFGVDHAARVAQISAAKAFRDAAPMAASILRAHALYGHDLVIVHSDAMLGIEAFGARLSFPEAGPPTLVSRPRRPPRRPIDPWRDGRVPVLLEAACMVRSRLAGDAYVVVSLTGPFALAAGVMGEAAFLGSLSTLGTQERDLLECAEQSLGRTMNAAQGEGLGIMVAEPLAALIGPSMFLGTFAPMLTRILAHHDAIVHICGDSSHLLPFLPSLGAPAFSLDRVDLVEASQAFRGDPVVVGGLAPAAIREGAPDRVSSAVAQLCGRVEGGVIPCTGCDLIWDTPPANVQAFVRGARTALKCRSVGEDSLSLMSSVSPDTSSSPVPGVNRGAA